MKLTTSKTTKNKNYFKQFICQNRGSYNAFTAGDHTNFHFDIKQDKLEEILDQLVYKCSLYLNFWTLTTLQPCDFRFSQFFISPTFDENSTSREVEAVNSENEKNIMTDVWRNFLIDKATCNPNHDYSKFPVGKFFKLSH